MAAPIKPPEASPASKPALAKPAEAPATSQEVMVAPGAIGEAGGFEFHAAPRRPGSTRRASRGSSWPLIGLGVVTVIVLAGTVFGIGALMDRPQPIADRGQPPVEANSASDTPAPGPAEPQPTAPQLLPVPQLGATVGQPLQFQIRTNRSSLPAGNLRYSLTSTADEGATIDPQTGRFTWTPDHQHQDRSWEFTVQLADSDDPSLASSVTFQVAVPAMVAAGPAVDEDQLAAAPVTAEDAQATEPLPMPGSNSPELSAADLSLATPAMPDDLGDVLDSYDTSVLFKLTHYPKVRKLFADRFERQHESEIRQAFGPDYDALAAWFNQHPQIKEELYTAIQPEFDDVAAALGLFRELHNEFPNKIAAYANLAIATAVTWDQPRRGVYDYVGHQQRTKSILPEQRAEAIDNFRYMLDAERFMQGRGQFLPWEFLTLLVDHRTPVDERQWAMANYLNQRAGFGKCYKDVPYDTEMLNSQSAVCRLAGQLYTLPNLRQFGGVCSMQADFAARVGKSMGVPAAYVTGESSYLGRHAWVMWVELRSVTQNSIGFSLESHGRYFGDKYYVGRLRDPHTGQEITDRDLELRLHLVGMNAVGKRHAALLMKLFPEIRERRQLDVNARLRYLRSVLDACPGNEEAWIAVSHMASEEEVRQKHKKQMTQVLDGLFRTFAQFPDFTWKIFDDVVAFEESLKSRTQFYERLVLLYESAGRPDLACEARLKLADYQVEDKRPMDAIHGLAFTIKKFPEEGRYVPRMLDKLETICLEVPEAQKHLLAFYGSFLPLVPQMRGDRPSTYCIEMFERGIDRFQQFGQVQTAQLLQLEVNKIKAGQGRRNRG